MWLITALLILQGFCMSEIDTSKIAVFRVPTRAQLDSVLNEAERSYVPASLVPVPDNSRGEYYDAGMGGGSNQEDRLLRWWLAWKIYNDPIARHNGLAWAHYRATHSPRGASDAYIIPGETSSRETWDNQHNQEAGSLALWYLEETDETRRAAILNGILLFYNNDICGSDRYPRSRPYIASTRPTARIWGTHLRVIKALELFRDAGVIRDEWPITRRRLSEQKTFLLEYITQVLNTSWRRAGDRGFYGQPGEWHQQLSFDIPAWRGGSGADDTCFMVGHIMPWALFIIITLEPEYARRHAVKERLEDISLYFLDRWYAPQFSSYLEAKRGSFDVTNLVAYGKFRLWAQNTGIEENIDNYHEIFLAFKFLPKDILKKRPYAIDFLKTCNIPNGRVLEQLCEVVVSTFSHGE